MIWMVVPVEKFSKVMFIMMIWGRVDGTYKVFESMVDLRVLPVVNLCLLEMFYHNNFIVNKYFCHCF
jgi:hypothetical protein